MPRVWSNMLSSAGIHCATGTVYGAETARLLLPTVGRLHEIMANENKATATTTASLSTHVSPGEFGRP